MPATNLKNELRKPALAWSTNTLPKTEDQGKRSEDRFRSQTYTRPIPVLLEYALPNNISKINLMHADIV